ncbi:MAG: mechanosensitive ion channel family protein [Novosphingobium sp.]|nr:mechanosensitive ion channel family protein [Novosphingobium sp.]MCP5401640.1 mechanosensitive ion channel family protein [Novosphingobium sp.]
MQDRFAQFAANLPHLMDRLFVVAVAAAVAVVVALLAHQLLFRAMRRLAGASESEADNILVKRLARPTRYSLIALALVLAAGEIPELQGVLERIAGFVMPALVGWVGLAILRALVDAMILRNDISSADNREARRKRTRLLIFSRIASFLVIFVTIGLMLLSIPAVRDIGVALVASAGLGALAVGAAAQPALKSLIGGIQMALTEPISIDDVVIIDGEWGRVETIRTTYVVVVTWDERRLIVPITKFLEETFQNWTKDSADLLAPVILHLDPLADIAPLRAEFERQVTGHKLWDGRVQVLQVTETYVDSIEVRLLMSACDAPTAFDLRCEIRETMLAWIRENQPEAIVRRRLEPSAPVDVRTAG